MAELQTIVPQLEKLGYQLLAISGDTPENSGKLVASTKLTYPVLSDANLTLTQQFGIVFRQGQWLLPAPSVFITDTKGIIQFQHVDPNYRMRLAPEALLTAAKAGLQAIK